MFENFTAGDTLLIRMEGSVNGLAMRVTYDGERAGVHHMSGIGVMSDAKFGAVKTPEGWELVNGRRLVGVEAA